MLKRIFGFAIMMSLFSGELAHATNILFDESIKCTVGPKEELSLWIRQVASDLKETKPFYMYDGKEIALESVRRKIEFSVRQKAIADLDVDFYMLQNPKEKSGFGLVGAELISPEAFIYGGKPSALTLTFLYSVPGAAFLKTENSKLIAK